MGLIDGVLNKYSPKNLLYIIDSRPEIFEMDEEAVRSAWEHLMEVKDTGGGISEEEAQLILDWSVQKTRVVLDELLRQQGSSIETDSLFSYCGFAQMCSLAFFQRAGLKITINQVKDICLNGPNHAFGTLTLPIEKDGIVKESQYLLDVTYRQFFSTIYCQKKMYDGMRGPWAGYYMINHYAGKDIADKILKRGYIEITPPVLIKYLCSFIASTLTEYDENKIDEILEYANYNEFARALEEKQIRFDYSEEKIDEILEIVSPPLGAYRR